MVTRKGNFIVFFFPKASRRVTFVVCVLRRCKKEPILYWDDTPECYLVFLKTYLGGILNALNMYFKTTTTFGNWSGLIYQKFSQGNIPGARPIGKHLDLYYLPTICSSRCVICPWPSTFFLRLLAVYSNFNIPTRGKQWLLRGTWSHRSFFNNSLGIENAIILVLIPVSTLRQR